MEVPFYSTDRYTVIRTFLAWEEKIKLDNEIYIIRPICGLNHENAPILAQDGIFAQVPDRLGAFMKIDCQWFQKSVGLTIIDSLWYIILENIDNEYNKLSTYLKFNHNLKLKLIKKIVAIFYALHYKTNQIYGYFDIDHFLIKKSESQISVKIKFPCAYLLPELDKKKSLLVATFETPESIINYSQQDQKSDVFSIACTIAKFVYGEIPNRFILDCYGFNFQEWEKVLSCEKVNGELWPILKKCLIQKQTERLSMGELLHKITAISSINYTAPNIVAIYGYYSQYGNITMIDVCSMIIKYKEKESMEKALQDQIKPFGQINIIS
jgi:hypothetical protein